MLYEIKNKPHLVRKYNDTIAECRREYPDFDLEDIETVDDLFNPVHLEEGYEGSPVGFYFCGLNSKHDLHWAGIDEAKLSWEESWMFLENKQEPLSGNHLCKYGVCDDAEQVIEYYRDFHHELFGEDKYIVFMTQIFREHEEEQGSWRWHKWGQYIGIQNPQHEYLYDDKHIDLVFVYDIVKIEELEDKRVWTDWREVFVEEGYTIMDDDGGRALYSEGRYEEEITEQEARRYLGRCTVMIRRA